MTFKLSLKKTWYSLILLVAVVPALLIIVWGGTFYYQLLLEKNLVEEDFFRELAVDHVKQEVERLGTLLENKSDPMAYTLARDMDKQLLNELLQKVVQRESAIHMLLIVGTDGKAITGIESYHGSSAPPLQQPGLMAHWQYPEGEFPEEITQPLRGKPYSSEVFIHPEGVFFVLSVPIGPVEKPLAVLLAHVDARILWQDLQDHLERKKVTSYLVDANGALLTVPKDSTYSTGDSVKHLPVVNALASGQAWLHDQVYTGLMGKPVFGSQSRLDDIGLGIITESTVNRFYNLFEPCYLT